jgi:hypothetical protein
MLRPSLNATSHARLEIALTQAIQSERRKSAKTAAVQKAGAGEDRLAEKTNSES